MTLSGTGKSPSRREHWSAAVPGGHSWHTAELRRRGDKNNKIAGTARKNYSWASNKNHTSLQLIVKVSQLFN